MVNKETVISMPVVFDIISTHYLDFERKHRELLSSGDHTAALGVVSAFRQRMAENIRRVHPRVRLHYDKFLLRHGLPQFALA